MSHASDESWTRADVGLKLAAPCVDTAEFNVGIGVPPTKSRESGGRPHEMGRSFSLLSAAWLAASLYSPNEP